MDATFRPHSVSPKLFAYAESKKIFEIFGTMLESLAVDRPPDPLEYLYDLLLKGGVYQTPAVYILGPSSPDRTLVCSALTSKLGLIHITRTSLLEVDDLVKVPCSPEWAAMVKKRVSMPDCARRGWILEAFPRTRSEAFLLRKLGIFPTHLALIEPADLNDVHRYDVNEETQTYLAQKLLLLDFHKNSRVKTFVLDSDVDASVNQVVEFVRTGKTPPKPYLPRVLLLGPYGSGRRTVAKRICEKYFLVQVDFQEELRKAVLKASPFKERIQALINESSPIPSCLLAEIASARLMEKDCIEKGWILCNFPETIEQAELLVKEMEGFQVNKAVFLDATLETCINRTVSRRMDSVTGKICNMSDVEDDVRQGPAKLRQDSAERVEAEYEWYSENVEALKSFFHSKMADDISIEVNANEADETVFECVQGAILQSSKMKLLE